MERFSLGTTLYSGPNALQQLRALCPGRTLLVTDRYFVQCGLAARVAALCGGRTEIFDRVAPEPTVELVTQGAVHLARLRPQTLLALGGGSVMDCAKGMLSAAQGSARLIAIPTTSGSGSEVTSFAVLTHAGCKHPLVDPALRPAAAILDASVLEALPPALIAETGMDAVAHCVEAAAATGAGAFSSAMAAQALDTALRLLPRSFQGEGRVRLALHEASCMAGIAFDNAGLGACHALAHAVGGSFHLPHGRLCGIFLPHVLAFNAPHATDAYQALARRCGLMGARGLIGAITRLRAALKLPASLAQAGLDAQALSERLDALCCAAAHDPCAKTNPTALTEADCRVLLLRAL